MKLLRDGPVRSARTVVLAHGAGAPMDSPFMSSVAAGLARRRIGVVRFEFPFMERARGGGRRGAPDRAELLRACWLEVIGELGDPVRLVIGGKSLGGRVASLVADEAGVAGLVCLGYPFHPPGRPERTRTAHLATLATPTLIVQGTRDPFGGPDDVSGYELAPSIELTWIADGDHSLAPRKRSGRTVDDNLTAAIAAVAAFVSSRLPFRAARAAR